MNVIDQKESSKNDDYAMVKHRNILCDLALTNNEDLFCPIVINLLNEINVLLLQNRIKG